MNIKEVENHIGKVVSFNPETKPYTNASLGATLSDVNVSHGWIRSAHKDEGDCCIVITDSKYNSKEIYINPKHIELKKDMKPIKIRLYNPDQFKPIFKKLIKLGYHTDSKPPAFAQYIYTMNDGRICYDFFKSTDNHSIVWSDDNNPDDPLKYFNDHNAIEITHTQLSNLNNAYLT